MGKPAFFVRRPRRAARILPGMPPRIVSLLPGTTEIVHLLGLGGSLVGVTHECDFPEAVTRLPRVVRAAFDASGLAQRDIDARVREIAASGGPLNVIDARLLAALAPQLVLTQQLCDVCAVSSGAAHRAIQGIRPAPEILSLHPHSLAEAIDDVERVGAAAGVASRARDEAARLRSRLSRVEAATGSLPRRRVAVIEWLDPLMASGHWVGDMVRCAGGTEELGACGGPSVRVPWERLRECDPEVLILAPCGFGLERSAADARALEGLPGWGRLGAVRAGEVYAFDGNAHLSRPGPRLVEGVEILAQILHPAAFPASGAPRKYRRIEVSR
jgi:iron complex transport system substrate-binding protein